MKKLILILLACVMLIGCFVSCDAIDKEPVELSREGKDQEIVSTLIQHMQRKTGFVDAVDLPMSHEIEEVKAGTSQAIHVAFNPRDYYFVCAYHNAAHEHVDDLSCCKEYNYTWVKFSRKEDITKQYNGKELVAAFQINKARVVRDIVNRRADTIEMEYYSEYSPEFKDGVNVADEIYCDQTYIYIKSNHWVLGDYLLDTCDGKYYNNINKWPCVKYKGGYYIKQVTKIGYQSEKNLKNEFGEYHDELMDIMVVDKYTEQVGQKTYYYGLININKFAKKILK